MPEHGDLDTSKIFVVEHMTFPELGNATFYVAVGEKATNKCDRDSAMFKLGNGHMYTAQNKRTDPQTSVPCNVYGTKGFEFIAPDLAEETPSIPVVKEVKRWIKDTLNKIMKGRGFGGGCHISYNR